MGLFRVNEEERERADDLARSYSELRQLLAGKHLLSIIDHHMGQAQTDSDSIDIQHLTSNEIAFYRGVRTGLKRLKGEIELASKGGS